MNLAIVTHTISRNDGQGRVNYEIARAALTRGDHVTLVASVVSPDLRSHPRVRWSSISVEGWPTALLRNQVFALKSARWLRQHRDEIDVILANGCITWASAHVNVAHFVHSAWLRSEVHTARLQHGPAAWYQWLYTALNARWERRAFQQANTVVAVSERIREELLAIGVPDDKIQVLPNGVQLDEFRPGNASRSSLGVPGGVPLALFVGDLQTPRKNLDTVLHALKEVPTLHLAVVGALDGSPYPNLARSLDLEDRVHFLGFRTDVAQLMQAADLCVCPSRYEPFSLVLLEALASGLPVVTSKAVGAASLLTDACGVVVEDAEDPSALAAALTALLRRPERQRSMHQAVRTVAERYSWQRMADSYLSLLDATATAVHRPSTSFSPAVH